MSDWDPVFAADTSWAELQALIAEWTDIWLAALRVQLEADPEITPALQASLLARARPLMEAQTRETFEAAWRRLQAEAQPTSGAH